MKYIEVKTSEDMTDCQECVFFTNCIPPGCRLKAGYHWEEK